MSKLDPRNREEAFSWQFEDDVKMLRSISMLDNQQSFDKALQTLLAHIKAYYSTRLIKKTKAAEKKYNEQKEFIKKNYPSLYKLIYS